MGADLIESLLEIIKLIIPAAAAVLAVHFTLKSFAAKEQQKALNDIKVKEAEIILPLRLQAYERICLLIERISPENLVLRINHGAYTVPQLQQELFSEIRNELNHNLSQQLYVSDKAWKLTRQVTEAVKGLIHKSAQELPHDAVTGNDLARKILENTYNLNPNPIHDALELIKSEIQHKFQ